jgi:dTDP-4-dehydrorhamnose reductase
MKVKRFLITGGSGLLGCNLALTLSERIDIVATYFQHPLYFENVEMIKMDIANAKETYEAIEKYKPNVLIHCAGETRVDYCEDHPDEAFRINVKGTENLVRAVSLLKAKFVYISTDSIFDGLQGMYAEEGIPNPINAYAKTKLTGEEVVQKFANDYLIVRTNIYGWNPGTKLSLAEWVLRRLEKGHMVPSFSDIYFSPILTTDLAEILAEMIISDLGGLYHVASSERCSKFDFARMICRVFEKNDGLVQEAFSEEAGLVALRPKDTSLDVRKVTKALGRPMPGIMEGLRRFRRQFEDGYVTKLFSGSTYKESIV